MPTVEHMHKRDGDQHLVFKVAKLWPIILTLVGLVAAVAVAQFKLENHETRITKLERTSQDVRDIRQNTNAILDAMRTRGYPVRRTQVEEDYNGE